MSISFYPARRTIKLQNSTTRRMEPHFIEVTVGQGTGLGYFPTSGEDGAGFTLFHVPSGLKLCSVTVPSDQLAQEWLTFVAMLTDWNVDEANIRAAGKQGKWIMSIPEWIATKREQVGIPCQCCDYKFFREELHEFHGGLLCSDCLPDEVEDGIA